MDAIEHYRRGEWWARVAERLADARMYDTRVYEAVNQAGVHLHVAMANMHFRAVSAAALLRQHYPAAYSEALKDGPEAARTLAETWPGTPDLERQAERFKVGHPGTPPGAS